MNKSTFNLFGSAGPNGAMSKDNLCFIQKTIDDATWNINCAKGILRINGEERLQNVEFVNALDDRVEVCLYDGTKQTVFYDKERVVGENDKKEDEKPKPKEKLQGVTKKKNNKKEKKTKTIICQTFGSNSVTHNTGIINFF